MGSSRVWMPCFVVLLLLAGCQEVDPDLEAEGGTHQPSASTTTAQPGQGGGNAGWTELPEPSIQAAALPDNSAPLLPSLMEPVSGEAIDPKVLAGIDGCAGCHQEIAAEWRSSSHALASFNNPYYRGTVDRIREEVGNKASRHCGGCHDTALMPEGGMDGEVRPEDPLAHAGVTCTVCHGIESVSPDGNASFGLTTRAIPIPVEGDAKSLEAHRARLALKPLRTPEMCVTCHRGLLGPGTGNPHYMVGMDDATEWRRSIYGKQGLERLDEEIAARTCLDCHMPEVDGHVSHRFPGSQTALAAGVGDKAQLEAHQRLLRSAATIDIAVAHLADGRRVLPADGAPVIPGEPLVLDVVVRNVGAGHRFPAGTLDAQDTWIEVTVEDARGRLVAEAGTRHEATREDPTAHLLKATPVDAEGRPRVIHDVWTFRAVAWNHTIPAREAAVIQYRLEIPADLSPDALPLRVNAKLRHRRHGKALHDLACESSRSDRGRAFAEASMRLKGFQIDGCAPQPLTEVAGATVWIGAGWDRLPPGHSGQDRVGTGQGGTVRPDSASRPEWRRLYEHGLGWLGALQERTDEARPSLEAALRLVQREGTPREQAVVLSALADLEANQGRTAEALRLLDAAERLVPGAPALKFQRGKALSAVWRWNEAREALHDAARQVPGSAPAHRLLAVAAASSQQDRLALAAAQRGLKGQRRDATLLRVQALSLERLGAPEEVVAQAREAYLTYRPYDEAPNARGRCQENSEPCRLEQNPIHVHPLRPAR